MKLLTASSSKYFLTEYVSCDRIPIIGVSAASEKKNDKKIVTIVKILNIVPLQETSNKRLGRLLLNTYYLMEKLSVYK